MGESYTFTPEKLRELQLKGLEMALYFKKICDENGLLFYFCGGCCIGALRHQGFIPWDDDVDVFMPRPDYERLKEVWPQKADTRRYSICYPTRERVDGNLFITIKDNETTYIKPYQKQMDIPHGVVLDILPLDGCPSDPGKRKRQKFWALLYSLYCAQQVPTNHGKKVAALARVALTCVPFKGLRYKLWKLAERKMTQYPIAQCEKITELCAGPHYMQNEYPRAAFDSAVYRAFEGHPMPLPVGYDQYLTIAFGDYMQLPPKEKQVAHHDCLFCDLEHGYQQYKGIYYCTED
ncbi:LicD family protein [Bittarella massiliensis (ex Durand et al. 2017)]|uniref:LicD family protein n=1 Tax=Bittarella massiliensis (ex Durand et al. 2017) TaxID=1720313 RepID=UPI00073EF088|nr:LicD family protein [Bittarella massiliensis (ex Durand et al. 2017)]